MIYKTGIRRKVIIIICLSMLIVMSIGIFIGYLFGFTLLRDTVGDVHRKLSQLLAGHITKIFDEEMGKISSYATNPLWAESAAKSNNKEHMDGEVSAKLKKLTKEDENIAYASIFNKSGALIAASDKPGTSYLAEKGLNEDALTGKKGRTFIGNIEFNEVANAWVIPIVMPIRDDIGTVIGLFRAEIAAQKFFSSLDNFRVDSTGHAVLLDGRGNIMFHPGIAPTNVKLCSDEDYKRLLTSKGKYATIYEPNIHQRKVFVAFSEVAQPVLLENKKVWRVLIDQDVKEVFAPLNRIILWMLLAIVFLLVLMGVIGFIFSGVLVRPVLKLYEAAVEIMKGNWDYKIDIRTGDEIEQFADAFKEMITTIKNKQEELLNAKNELEVLSKSLENKVKERTKDLTMARDKLDRYTKELQRALMVKSDFISMASHELRTPLAAIKEGIGIVLTAKTGSINEEQGKFLDMAARNVDRLGRLINDILDFQKLEYDKMAMKLEYNDINEIVKDEYETMVHLANEKGLQLIFEVGTGIPKIKFDKDRIAQVLSNLISNAIKFTEKGVIKVSTCRDENIVKVAVSDTGIGIREESIPQLFQKFTQIEKGLERKTGGTGLGLIISKQIIEKHGGRIWAESKFGEGTTFHFVLPISERRTRV